MACVDGVTRLWTERAWLEWSVRHSVTMVTRFLEPIAGCASRRPYRDAAVHTRFGERVAQPGIARAHFRDCQVAVRALGAEAQVDSGEESDRRKAAEHEDNERIAEQELPNCSHERVRRNPSQTEPQSREASLPESSPRSQIRVGLDGRRMRLAKRRRHGRSLQRGARVRKSRAMSRTRTRHASRRRSWSVPCSISTHSLDQPQSAQRAVASDVSHSTRRSSRSRCRCLPTVT